MCLKHDKIEKFEQISGNSQHRGDIKEKSGNLRTEKYKTEDSVDELNSGMEGSEGKKSDLEYRAIVIAQSAQYRENRMGWGGGMNRASVIYGPTAKI